MESTKLKKLISTFDPAVNIGRSLISRYQQERDITLLELRAGVQPTLYYLRRIPNGLLLRYVDVPVEEQLKHIRAFECAVVRAEHLTTPDGQYWPVWEPAQMLEQPGVGGALAVMQPADLELFPPDDVLDIGAAAYGHAFLRHGSVRSYPVPPSSPHALERAIAASMQLHGAESRSLSAAPSGPQEPSSGQPEEPPTPGSGQPSAPPGAATAAG